MTTAITGTGYAPANGLQMYYEVHGTLTTRPPLLLVHGSLGATSMFAQQLPVLAETRRAIAVDLQAHGRTADVNRPLSFEQMADDVAALIKHLGLERVDLLGYSMGGGVALQTAIRHPDVVRKLVIVSAAFKSDGWYPESRAGMAAVNGELARTWIGSPMHQAYAEVAPKPEEWPHLADKLGRMLRQDYDWSAGVAAIKAPAMIVVGDSDGVRLAHAVEMFGLFGGGKTDVGMGDLPPSRLAVLPGTTHLGMIFGPDQLSPILPPFLDAPMPETQVITA